MSRDKRIINSRLQRALTSGEQEEDEFFAGLEFALGAMNACDCLYLLDEELVEEFMRNNYPPMTITEGVGFSDFTRYGYEYSKYLPSYRSAGEFAKQGYRNLKASDVPECQDMFYCVYLIRDLRNIPDFGENESVRQALEDRLSRCEEILFQYYQENK